MSQSLGSPTPPDDATPSPPGLTASPSRRGLRFDELARKIQRFEGVVAVLVSLLILVASAVLYLGAIWLSNQLVGPKPRAIAIDMISIAEDADEGASGDPSDSPVALPQQNLTLEEPDQPDAVESIVSAVASLETDMLMVERQTGGGPEGQHGGASGTGRQGTGEGRGGIPRSMRWRIEFPENQTLNDYAKTLDFFGIELGVVRGREVTIVSNLSSPRPTIERNPPDDQRLFFVWQEPARKDADRRLLQQAGVLPDGAILAHFYPRPLEDRLAALEQSFAGRDPRDIRQTRFAIRPAGKSYEFVVLGQQEFRD